MIEIKNLTKTIAGNKILDDVNFSVQKGEILGFLGPNGAGKTTTMKIITSFWSPSSGSVTIDGLDSENDSLAVRQKIGYLPEMVPLYEDMKVREYLKFAGEMRGLAKKELADRISYVIEACSLEKVLEKTIDELSKGYRQRVGLAQAIIGSPEVLILDEPTTGLDPNQIAEIRELIKKIGQEKTVIFSTHILAEAAAVCDRVIIINRGKIVGEGSPAELAKKAGAKEIIYLKTDGPKENVLEVLQKIIGVIRAEVKDQSGDGVGYEIESDGADLRSAITQVVVANNWNILEISKSKANLEDVFRELTK
ncbi:MAG: ATP-binding cassette domain-containing protein [Patescibacteria group bacterium]|jgi:ABC-2 type transport system ATP-binding protein